MNKKEFNNIRQDDAIRFKKTNEIWFVKYCFNNCYLAVRYKPVDNPDEWETTDRRGKMMSEEDK